MRIYKLKALRDFRDKYTKEDYSKGQELVDIEEERAFELLSSDNSLVKYVSHTDDNKDLEEVENIKKENDTVKAENESLKTENDTIKAENEELKKEVEALKASQNSDKTNKSK